MINVDWGQADLPHVFLPAGTHRTIHVPISSGAESMELEICLDNLYDRSRHTLFQGRIELTSPSGVYDIPVQLPQVDQPTEFLLVVMGEARQIITLEP
jgi:hypothetical protein